MTVMHLMDELHKQVGDFILKDNKLEYPNIKNFVDKAVAEKLKREYKREK